MLLASDSAMKQGHRARHIASAITCSRPLTVKHTLFLKHNPTLCVCVCDLNFTMLPPLPEIPSELTTAFVGLAFAGGLMPSVMQANTKALGNLRAGDVVVAADVDLAALDTTPTLPCSPLLMYKAPLKLGSLVGVVGRFSLADECGPLPECRREDRYLQRDEWEAAIAARSPPTSWPLGANAVPLLGDGYPSPHLCLGDECEAAQQPSVLALDACWVALSCGASFVSHQEVDRQLSRWRPDERTFVLEEFETSLLQGRAVQLSGYVILFGLQALVAGVLVVPPLAASLAGQYQ